MSCILASLVSYVGCYCCHRFLQRHVHIVHGSGRCIALLKPCLSSWGVAPPSSTEGWCPSSPPPPLRDGASPWKCNNLSTWISIPLILFAFFCRAFLHEKRNASLFYLLFLEGSEALRRDCSSLWYLEWLRPSLPNLSLNEVIWAGT